MGRTYFGDVLTSDTEVEEVIEKRTVLYDTHHHNVGQLHNTILHECFHWYKHRHYFALKRYFDAEEVEKLYKEDAVFWIEKQARAITPRILMPRKTFSKMARRIISELELTIGGSYLKILEQAITKLASFFQVSRLSAKLRMVEIGYPEAKGVLDYIDGRYLPAYSFKVNDFKGNQTFTIPLREVDKLLKENTDFSNVMKMGLYVYLESHFVLNLPDYVEHDELVNFKTEKHYKDKRNHYVDKDKWQVIKNVYEPIIDRATYENVQRILKNAPVKRPNGDGEIHPLSGLMYCKDCGTKMHIRTIHKNGKVQHVTYCSEYAKGKSKHPKCNSPHRLSRPKKICCPFLKILSVKMQIRIMQT